MLQACGLSRRGQSCCSLSRAALWKSDWGTVPVCCLCILYFHRSRKEIVFKDCAKSNYTQVAMQSPLIRNLKIVLIALYQWPYDTVVTGLTELHFSDRYCRTIVAGHDRSGGIPRHTVIQAAWGEKTEYQERGHTVSAQHVPIWRACKVYRRANFGDGHKAQSI